MKILNTWYDFFPTPDSTMIRTQISEVTGEKDFHDHCRFPLMLYVVSLHWSTRITLPLVDLENLGLNEVGVLCIIMYTKKSVVLNLCDGLFYLLEKGWPFQIKSLGTFKCIV